jgi:hypothetical protein
MRRALVIVALTAALIGPARGFDFEPATPLDVPKLAPEMLANVLGTWEIRDKSGKKRCRITLQKEFTIGGYQADVAPGCEKAFPVMADISGWRLLEGWTIDLVDPLRKTRVRFETPDNRYVALGDPKDIAGIYELLRVQDTKGKGGPKKP